MINNFRVTVILALAIFFTNIVPFPGQADAEETQLAKNRVVALVFDDSGSMWAAEDKTTGKMKAIDNWKYANYSLQSLTALLAPEDSLHVIKMTEPTKIEEIALAPNRRQRSIDTIQAWTENKNTPFQSLITAMEHLKKVAEKQPDSEFWLVVLTDGVFNELDHSAGEDLVEHNMGIARSALEEFSQTMKSYNAVTHSAMVTVDSSIDETDQQSMDVIKSMWQEALDGKVIESNGQANIIENINEVAALITNRDPDAGALLDLNPVFTGDQIQFTSLFPLKRLTLLEQTVADSPQTIIPKEAGKLTINQTAATSIDGPFQIATPDDPFLLNPPIIGQVTHYRPKSKGDVLPEGEYRIELKNAKERQDRLQFLVEPALDFHITVHKQQPNGALTQEENEFFYGSPMVAQITLVKSNTSNEPLQLLPATIEKISVSAKLGDQTLEFVWNEALQSFTAPFELPGNEVNEIEAAVNIKGFFQKGKSMTFRGFPPRVFGMEAGQAEWSSRVDQFDHAQPLLFIPTADGLPITAEELTEILPTLEINAGGKRINFAVEQDGSSIVLRPKLYWNSVLFTSVGDTPIQVSIKGKYPNETANVTYSIIIQDIAWWLKYGVPLIILIVSVVLIWWLIGVIRKPRFRRQSASVEVVTRPIINGKPISNSYNTTFQFRSNWFSRWIIPYRPEKASVSSITFEAGQKGDFIVLPKASQSPDMIVADSPLAEDAGKRDKRIYSNDEIILRTPNTEEIYKYVKG